MKQKRFLLLLLLEACCAIALYLFQFSQYQLMTTLLAFPWEPLGIGLRALSLSGSAGNIAAWILYVIVCLLPAGLLLLPLRKHRLYPEDVILALITVCLFFFLYWMINPALLPSEGCAVRSVANLSLNLFLRRGMHLKEKFSDIFFYSLVYSVCLKPRQMNYGV